MSDLLGMQRAVWRSKRSTTEKIVLLAILDHYSDSSPEPWPSVNRLAEHCGLGRTAVLEALAALESAGVLVVKRAAGCPNHYDLSQLVQALGTEPVRDADPSASQTSPPGEPTPVRQTDGTSPPGGPEGTQEETKYGTHCRARARATRPEHAAGRARATRAPRSARSGTAAAARLARNEADRRRLRRGDRQPAHAFRAEARFRTARHPRAHCGGLRGRRHHVAGFERAAGSVVAQR